MLFRSLELVRALRAGAKPAPTRGAPLSDFREASRQLAGFFDRPEDVAGPSAAPETLRGVADAAEHGWTAPVPPEPQPAEPAAPAEQEGTS